MASNMSVDFDELTKEISQAKREEFIQSYRNGTKPGGALLLEFLQAAKRKDQIKYSDKTYIDEDTKKPGFSFSCEIGNLAFPMGDIKPKKQDAKHSAALKALEVLLGLSLTADRPAALDVQEYDTGTTEVVAIPPTSRSDLVDMVGVREPSRQSEPVESVYSRSASNSEVIPVEDLDGPVPDRYKHKLQKEHRTLLENLQFKLLLPDLYSEGIISSLSYDEWSNQVEAGRSNFALKEFLLNCLPKVGYKKFQLFLNVLKKDQKWLYNLLASAETSTTSVQETAPLLYERTFSAPGSSASCAPLENSPSTPSASTNGSSTPRASKSEGIVNIEVVPSPSVVGSSSSVSAASVNQPSPSTSSRRSFGSPSVPGRLESVTEILRPLDIEALKEGLDGIKSPISALKELSDKYKGRINVEYEEAQGICYCNINSIPFEGQDTNKKQAKILAAKNAIERILMHTQQKDELRRVLDALDSSDLEALKLSLVPCVAKGPISVLKELTEKYKSNFTVEYKEKPNPSNETRDGLFTYSCEVKGLELGCATLLGKKAAQRESAEKAIRKLLLSAGELPGPSVTSDADPFDDPGEAASPERVASQLGSLHFTPDEPPGAAAPYRYPIVNPSGDQNSLGSYSMASEPKGYVLIINNVKFADPKKHDKRDGSVKDRDRLCKTFTQCGFRVEILENLGSEAMLTVIAEFSERRELKETDSFVLAILSHGESGAVIGSDNQPVQLEKIYKMFGADRCASLHGKPKFFIIQACRGGDYDRGSLLRADSTSDSPSGGQSQASNEDLQSMLVADNNQSRPSPTLADFIYAYATVPHYVSIRDTNNGSIFIRHLCDVFDERAKEEHVGDMLIEVNRKVSQEYNKVLQNDGSFKIHLQMPEQHTTLTKKWYLFQR